MINENYFIQKGGGLNMFLFILIFIIIIGLLIFLYFILF